MKKTILAGFVAAITILSLVGCQSTENKQTNNTAQTSNLEKKAFNLGYLNSTAHLLAFVAKEEGYFIKCVFVLTVDPQINIARIESRVAAGGHNVDSSKVIERYYKSINNIKELLDICDIMHVYDNTKSPERIIRKHKEELSIYPNEYWSEQDILGLME